MDNAQNVKSTVLPAEPKAAPKKRKGKSLEKQVLFHGFSKGFFGMLQASHPFFHGFHIPYYYY